MNTQHHLQNDHSSNADNNLDNDAYQYLPMIADAQVGRSLDSASPSTPGQSTVFLRNPSTVNRLIE